MTWDWFIKNILYLYNTSNSLLLFNFISSKHSVYWSLEQIWETMRIWEKPTPDQTKNKPNLNLSSKHIHSLYKQTRLVLTPATPSLSVLQNKCYILLCATHDARSICTSIQSLRLWNLLPLPSYFLPVFVLLPFPDLPPVLLPFPDLPPLWKKKGWMPVYDIMLEIIWNLIIQQKWALTDTTQNLRGWGRWRSWLSRGFKRWLSRLIERERANWWMSKHKF